MARITESRFASDFVKLWHLLNDLDALKAKLRARGLSACKTCSGSKRDKKLIREYFRARNAASAIVNSIGVQIES